MREIKFKAKRSDNGEWVDGYYAKSCVDDYIVNDEYSHEIDPNTLCQFTGLLDRNGKEIYEGDIIRIHEGKDDFKETHLIWDNEWCLFVPSNSKLRHRIQAKHYEHYEVIGNIHDK